MENSFKFGKWQILTELMGILTRKRKVRFFTSLATDYTNEHGLKSRGKN